MMKNISRFLIIAGLMVSVACGKEEPLPAHQTPSVKDHGDQIEIVATDSSITIDQGKALINHYRASLSNPGNPEVKEDPTRRYSMDEARGQVVLRVHRVDPPGSLMRLAYPEGRDPIFIIFNEMPDNSGNHYIFESPTDN
jgi:hypothetical protein